MCADVDGRGPVNDNGAYQGPAANTTPGEDAITRRDRQPTAEELLERPHALLNRSHLAELGLGRRAVDAVFQQLDVVCFPGSRRPLVRASDFLELVERSTYACDRVR